MLLMQNNRVIHFMEYTGTSTLVPVLKKQVERRCIVTIGMYQPKKNLAAAIAICGIGRELFRYTNTTIIVLGLRAELICYNIKMRERECVCAVSYTHLDVYKRQTLYFY